MPWRLMVADPCWDAEREALAASIPPRDARRLANLLRDSRTVIAVGFFPLLGLLLIPRLVQWHLLAGRHPLLLQPVESRLVAEFREARGRFWFAILFWPVVLRVVWICCTTV